MLTSGDQINRVAIAQASAIAANRWEDHCVSRHVTGVAQGSQVDLMLINSTQWLQVMESEDGRRLPKQTGKLRLMCEANPMSWLIKQAAQGVRRPCAGPCAGRGGTRRRPCHARTATGRPRSSLTTDQREHRLQFASSRLDNLAASVLWPRKKRPSP